ncbi:MAG: ABC transporter [Rhodospirillaceae bacterium]|nr:ABC transporter [Rhodospirillaceae bacterium]MBT7265504.1 ABC transporter [Rhodospirillaceae bacterium]
MQALDNMDRKKLTIAGLVVAAIFLFFINIWSSLEIQTAQLDLTENKLYTLSDGTKEVMKSIDEPITFRLYYSPTFGEISPPHGNYFRRVRELLEHFAVVSDGKINLKIINPVSFSVEEDEAVKFGIQGVPLDQSGELGYFGMAAVNSTDDRKVVPFFNPQREQFLEYDLTRLVFELAEPKKKKIGLITSLLIESDPMLQYKPWPIMTQVTQFFDVKSIDSAAAKIDDDIDVLLVVHPKILEEKLMYAIDQFVMRGGRLLVFLDPQNETARMTPRAPPGAGSSELKKLFDVWGIEYDEDKFVGDRTRAIRVQAPVKGRDVIADYLSWGIYDKRAINEKDVVTGQLTAISLASAGTLELKKGSALKMIPLLQTSKISQRIDAELVRGEINPEAILKQFKSENRSFTIAARFSGKVKSAFPDGPPKPKKDAKKKDDDKKPVKLAPHMNESKADLNMIVMADSDMLSSRFWVREQDFFGKKIQTPVSNNADFLVNSLENLGGSQALISLRSRGLSVRPFHTIQDLKNDAEDKYRKTEQQLTAKLKDLQGKLQGLGKINQGKGKVVLTSAQQKAFAQFQAEMLDVRKKLRDVQLALRKDIEQLDTKLKILNIWTMPLVIAVVAIILAIFRRRRYSQQTAQG